MHPTYPHLFSPIQLGPIEVPNRFYFSPHGVHLTVGSKPSLDYVQYKVARVKDHGCGLVVCSLTASERGRNSQPSPYLRQNVPAFRALADKVHEAGGRIFGQIWYWWGTCGSWQPYSTPAPALSASPVQFSYADRQVSTHQMGKAEIRGMVNALLRSTTHLREAGFDGVMLHASHGGMIEQFVSPYFNSRTDEYGGTFENRIRFLIESLEAAREGAAGKIAVGMRLNCDELLPGGYNTEGARDILGYVARAGLLDFVDLDVAIEPNQLHYGMPPVFVPPQVYRPFVEKVRSAAGQIPVLSVLGRTTSIAEAEAALEAGVCDMVGATRSLIAEPELVKNAFYGREARSRTCIACNWCLMAAQEGGAQGCTINPASYRERLWGDGGFVPAQHSSKVIVIGGGPGGLEAARVCALRGHQVIVYEARNRLGGALALWADLPGREFFWKSIEWWTRELDRLQVRIKLGIEATASGVLGERPDAVIVATGALYSTGGRSAFLDCDIPGYEQSFVYRPEDILLGRVKPQGKVVLLDAEGLHTSLGVAEVLGSAGAEVHYLTPSFAPVSPRLVANQDHRFIMKRLHCAGVTFSPTTYIRKIGDHAVTTFDVYSEQERTIDGVSAVVLATARIPVNRLESELEGAVPQLFTVGDALAARMFAHASFEGQKFARLIGEPDAPRSFADAYFQDNPPEFATAAADHGHTATRL